MRCIASLLVTLSHFHRLRHWLTLRMSRNRSPPVCPTWQPSINLRLHTQSESTWELHPFYFIALSSFLAWKPIKDSFHLIAGDGFSEKCSDKPNAKRTNCTKTHTHSRTNTHTNIHTIRLSCLFLEILWPFPLVLVWSCFPPRPASAARSSSSSLIRTQAVRRGASHSWIFPISF